MDQAKQDQEIYRLYCSSIHCLRAANSKIWAESNLTMPQIKILFILAHKEELTISSIAKMLNVKAPNITYILDHLVEKGMVSRQRDKNDRRQVMASLTNKGQKIVDKFIRAKHERFQKALSKMTDSERKTLKQGLRALEKACKLS